jgi:hypothetical protein
MKHAPSPLLAILCLLSVSPVALAACDVLLSDDGIVDHGKVLASSNKGVSWFPETVAYPNNYMGFASPGTRVPEPHCLLTATLHINTSINAASFLTLNQEVPLHGALVLDLRYL